MSHLRTFYIRLNECADYTTASRKPITKVNIDRIALVLLAETGKFQEYCRTWWAKLEAEKPWMDFQAHFIEAQANLHEQQQTYHQEGYTSVVSHNLVRIQDEFSNLAQALAEDWAAIKNPTKSNSTLTNKVALYANHLSNKEVETGALQKAVRNLQG